MYTHSERYRSGHNEAVLKTVCPKGRVGSNPTLSARHSCRRSLYRLSESTIWRSTQEVEGTPLERVQVVNSGARVQIPPSPFLFFGKQKINKKDVDNRGKMLLFARMKFAKRKSVPFPQSEFSMEGWQSGQMQRTVNPSTLVYESSNLSPSTIF